MWPLIIALIILIIFLVYVNLIFWQLALELLVNLAILYAVFLRSEVEIVTENMGAFYIQGLVFGLVLFWIFPSLFIGPFIWWITMLAIVTIIVAQVTHHYKINALKWIYGKLAGKRRK